MDSIRDAQIFLARNAEQGTTCPCCNQKVKRYFRPLYGTVIKALIELYHVAKQNSEQEFFHISKLDLCGKSGDFAKLRWWNFIEEKVEKSENKRNSGHWKITEKGKLFVEDKLKVPRGYWSYNNSFLGFSHEEVGIKDVVKDGFDYQAVMEG